MIWEYILSGILDIIGLVCLVESIADAGIGSYPIPATAGVRTRTGGSVSLDLAQADRTDSL